MRRVEQESAIRKFEMAVRFADTTFSQEKQLVTDTRERRSLPTTL